MPELACLRPRFARHGGTDGPGQDLCQFLEWHDSHLGPSMDHDIVATRPVLSVQPENLTDAPLDPVAQHRVADSAAHGQSKTLATATGFRHENRTAATPCLAGCSINMLELPAASQAIVRLKPFMWWDLSSGHGIRPGAERN